MSKIVYNTTTGNISSVYADSESLPILPGGYSAFTAAVAVGDAILMHVDTSGPSLETRDYLRFTGPVSQAAASVVTHGVQKVDGSTDVDMANASDNEDIYVQLGTDSVPGSNAGFTDEPEDQLLFGAATFKVSAGPTQGTEVLYVKAAGLGVAKKDITYT